MSPVGADGSGGGTVNPSVVGGVGSATGTTPSTCAPAAISTFTAGVATLVSVVPSTVTL